MTGTLTETSSYDATVPEMETTDPVQGGPGGVSNAQAQALADRTKYLKGQVDTLNTEVAAIQAQLAAALTTQAAGDTSTAAATDAFVHRAQGGVATVNCAGNAPITLTGDQWGCAIIILTGALTGNVPVIFPARGDLWLVVNLTTGAYSITCKTATGTGVPVGQGLSKFVWSDGTNVYNAETDNTNRPQTISSAQVLQAGQQYTLDISGGIFSPSLPPAPQDGDKVVVRGNFLTTPVTILHNGNPIMDQTGTPQSSDYLANRNNCSVAFTWTVPATGTAAWLVTQG